MVGRTEVSDRAQLPLREEREGPGKCSERRPSRPWTTSEKRQQRDASGPERGEAAQVREVDDAEVDRGTSQGRAGCQALTRRPGLCLTCPGSISHVPKRATRPRTGEQQQQAGV